MTSGGGTGMGDEVATPPPRFNARAASEVVGGDVEGRGVEAFGLVGIDLDDPADADEEGLGDRVDGADRRAVEGQRQHRDRVRALVETGRRGDDYDHLLVGRARAGEA